MPTIGVTYRVTSPAVGATSAARALASVLGSAVGSAATVILVDTSYSECREAHGLPVVSLKDATDLDLLIDLDGLVSPWDRQRCAARTVVFLRESLAFTEMDASVYIETDYARRSFEGVAEIWCWDILNTDASLDSLRVMFPCPVRRVPFVWVPYGEGKMPTWRADLPWSVHIAERNLENTSSCILPLVIARHLYVEKFPAIWTVHNMGRIRDRKFLKENVLDNIEAEAMRIVMPTEAEVEAKAWTEDNAVILSHARFTPLAVGLLDALWTGIPLIHNSVLLRDLCPILKSTWYHGNEVTGAAHAFQALEEMRARGDTWPVTAIQEALQGAFGVEGRRAAWGDVLQAQGGRMAAAEAQEDLKAVETQEDLKAVETQEDLKGLEGRTLRIAFADMWPGFNPHTNFFMDALRHFGYTVEHTTTNASLLIFGPYGETWRTWNHIPRVYFSAENWSTADHAADAGAVLSLTSRMEEDSHHLRIPTWMTFIDWFSGATELPADTTDNPIRLPVHFATHPRTGWADRTRFCAFVVSNPTCTTRNVAFESVNAYKPVSSGGALYNNIGGPLALKYPGGGGGDLSKHAFFAEHRYTLSFENSQARGYVTEKLLHAKMAGCVPLYWGDADATSEFVPHSFVNLSANPSAARALLEKLEAHPAMGEAMAATPLLDAVRVGRAVEVQRAMCARLAAIGGVAPRRAPKGSAGTGTAAGAAGIAHTFVINLDHRRDRWDGLLAAEPYLKDWEAAGVLERVSAVNGKTMEMTAFIYQLFERNEFQWKKSIVGCNMSHIGVWDRIASSLHEGWHLVLEDDVRFVDGWRETWEKAVAEVPADAELLYVGGVLPPNKGALPLASQADGAYWSHIVPNTYFSASPAAVFHFCAYSYLLTRRGARRILDYLLDSDKKSFTVSDHLLGHPSVGLRKYFTRPLLSYCFQESDPAYVQSAFNDLHREDTFDSDIWNNKECFTEAELAPFRARKNVLDIFYYTNKPAEAEGLYERAWLEDTFGVTLNMRPLENVELTHHSWFLVQRPYLGHVVELFHRLEVARIPFHVIHLSDEFEADDLSWYALEMCQSVIRNYPRAVPPAVEAKVHVIPLGYHHRPVGTPKEWKARELVWSFHGTDWFDRGAHLECLTRYEPYRCHLQPHWNHPTATKERIYLSDLGCSRFCPVMKGQNAETFRMYEALEAGTLPVALMGAEGAAWVAWIEENMGLSALYPWTDHGVIGQELNEDIRRQVVAKWEAWKARVRTVCRGLL